VSIIYILVIRLQSGTMPTPTNINKNRKFLLSRVQEVAVGSDRTSRQWSAMVSEELLGHQPRGI
jgi:hypothetical protein